MEVIFQDLERGPGWVCVGKGAPTYGAPAITRKLAAFAGRTLLNQFAFIGVRWEIRAQRCRMSSSTALVPK